MRQKRLRTDILFLIVFTIWTIIASPLYYLIIRNEISYSENIIIIFRTIIGVIYSPVIFFPFILFLLHKHSKTTGDGIPLSLEAMRESKNHIPKKIYRFCSLTAKNSSDSLNNKKLDTLKNNEIWFSKCSDLNDPFEGQKFSIPENFFSQYGLPEELKQRYNVKNMEELISFLSNFRNKYCQVSFSSAQSDVLMWGYYANGCRGYSIEYEVFNDEYLFPVFYLNKRLILSGFFNNKKLEKVCRKNLNQLNKSLLKVSADEFIQYTLYLQSFKSSKWAFEKEIRAIDITSSDSEGYNQPTIDCGLQATKIIAGYLSEYVEELKEIAIQLGVSFSIMKPNFESNKFDLVEQKIL